MERLYEAAEEIRDLFLPFAGMSPSLEEIERAEKAGREGLRTIYLHLFAMASAELEVKSRSSGWYFLSTVSYEFEEISHIAAEIPFSSRDDRGCLEITNLILRFFSNEDLADKAGIFYYLKGITGINLSRILKEIARSEKRALHYVFSAVTRHVGSKARYGRRGNLVTDLEAPDLQAGREATTEEIVGACGHLAKGSETPGAMVDAIFDYLDGVDRYPSRLQISTLRTSVYGLIRSRFDLPGMETSNSDPMQEYVQKEMLRLAREAVDETLDQYNWREGGSAALRVSFGKAGTDILEELIIHGRKMPHHEALGRYIDGCDVEVYRGKYRGSFQNFWKSLWEDFLRKIRADL
jgi:hypothetical protein